MQKYLLSKFAHFSTTKYNTFQISFLANTRFKSVVKIVTDTLQNVCSVHTYIQYISANLNMCI